MMKYTSYGYTGAVNPNPINTWETGINIPKNSLKERITNKIEKFFKYKSTYNKFNFRI